MARCLLSRTTSRISPNTNRSPATVPDRLATSSAFPVTRPVAKRLAKCDDEFSSVTASLTRRDSSSLTANVLLARRVRQSCRRDRRRLRPAPPRYCRSISAWLFRRAELSWRSASSAGSSCAARMAPASRACGHSAAQATAHAAIPARAEPIRAPFHPEKPDVSRSSSKWCAAFKTQRPRRKKGFSGTTRLCRICMSK